MADVRDHVAAEMENIRRVLKEIPTHSECGGLSHLELAGVAALLHNFYNGIENVLKQVFQSRAVGMPTGDAWHRDLLARARTEGIVSTEVFDLLKPYLAFRHFFAHGYALDLDPDRLQPLVGNTDRTFGIFERDIDAFLKH